MGKTRTPPKQVHESTTPETASIRETEAVFWEISSKETWFYEFYEYHRVQSMVQLV